MVFQQLITGCLKGLLILFILIQLTSCSSGNSFDGTGNSGVAALTWVAPSLRQDGTPLSLSEIGGYKIYYGTKSGNYIDAVDIDDGSVTSVSLGNLPIPKGTYFVAMTALDVDGRESQFSFEVTISIKAST